MSSNLDSHNPIDAENAEALAKAIGAHAATDWKAAAWLLEHHPQHRQRWGNFEQLRAAVDSALVIVANGIRRSGLTLDQQQIVLLSISAAGLGLDETEEPDA
jgi:hypothetical protein